MLRRLFWKLVKTNTLPINTKKLNLNDCCLLWQMGYETPCQGRKVIEIRKRKDLFKGHKKLHCNHYNRLEEAGQIWKMKT